jgi:hypothetical protein
MTDTTLEPEVEIPEGMFMPAVLGINCDLSKTPTVERTLSDQTNAIYDARRLLQKVMRPPTSNFR